MCRPDHRRLLLPLSLLQSRLSQVREEADRLWMEVLEERALELLLREEERERPMQALRVKWRWLMERAHRRVAARKEREMALVLSPVVEMVSAMPRWRERTLLR